MKNKIIHFSSAFCLLFLLINFSCKENKIVENHTFSSENNCLKDKNYQYENILTKEDIAKHTQIDEASYKREISPTQGKYGSCSYSWKSDRPDLVVEILGQNISGPDLNRVNIKLLDFYSEDQSQQEILEILDRSYKKLSEEEYQNLLSKLEKEYQNNSEELERAKGFLEARKNLVYQSDNSVGDRAYWKWSDEYGIELIVLKGNTQFTIECKTAADKETNLKTALNLAKEILAKC